jgi:muramidase (phage lysozyme)
MNAKTFAPRIANVLAIGAVVFGLGALNGCAVETSEEAAADQGEDGDPDFDLNVSSDELRTNYPKGTVLEVTASQLNLRSAPGGAVLKLLPKGTRVTVLTEGGAGGWVNVSGAGTNGFVSADFVIKADSSPTPTPSGGTCDPSRAVGAVNRYQKGLHDAIAFAEGTKGRSKDGYNVGFAYKIFSSCARHPDVNTCSGRYCSTASGRYQFLTTTWRGTVRAIGATTFEPENQEKGAAYLIRNVRQATVPSNRALNATEFSTVMSKLAREWASLPGSPYGQPTKSLSTMRREYCSNVGC